MYLLDTNVVSELRKPENRRDPGVVRWVQEHNLSEMYISSITIYEIELGIKRLERKDHLQARGLRNWLEHTVLKYFGQNILDFNAEAAKIAARLNVPDQNPLADSFIAAICLSSQKTLITRNIKDFEPMGVSVVNPFSR